MIGGPSEPANLLRRDSDRFPLAPVRCRLAKQLKSGWGGGAVPGRGVAAARGVVLVELGIRTLEDVVNDNCAKNHEQHYNCDLLALVTQEFLAGHSEVKAPDLNC